LKGSSHEDMVGHEPVRASSDRAFGVVFAMLFFLLAVYSFWQGARWWWLAALAGACFALPAWLRPSVLAPLNRQWLRLGALLHRVMNPLVMGLMYYGVLLPTALLMRVFGKDPLRLRRRPEQESYWLPREAMRPDHFRDQF